MSERTVFTVLDQTADRHGDRAALQQPLGASGSGLKDKYRTYTWNEYRQIVREIAVGLRVIGVAKGDIVALQSETRAEFYLADLGVMSSGAIAAAVYTSLPLPEQVETLRASGARTLLVENPKAMAALANAAGKNALDVRWVLMTGEAEGILTLDQIRAMGREELTTNPQAFDHIRAGVKADDPAVLYMTSGATGTPKMGLVTHRGLVFNMDHGPQVIPLSPDESIIAFLPSAHIAQRVVVELLPIRDGSCVWFSEGLMKLPNELRTIKPTWLLAPPRVWERVYASIQSEIRKKPAAIRRLFYMGVGVGSEIARRKQQGRSIPPYLENARKFFDKVVFSKIRERLGGRLRMACSGAAPLGKDLAEFYASIGLPLIEGYGLTEGGVTALNPIHNPKPGSIGKLLPGVQARITEDGELALKSPANFLGYHNDPEATAQVLRDGWLYTGDIAEVDSDGFYYITGRKKELIVSSNGKKIYPARIETLFKKEPVINQVVLIGDKLPYVTALFTVNLANVETLKGMENLKGKAPAELVTATPVVAEVGRAVKDINRTLPSFEQIRKFRILEKEFTIESGELTPTMKVRRGKVLENYRDVVSELYMGKDFD
jgi:long-chain acyl-CoA synthetase